MIIDVEKNVYHDNLLHFGDKYHTIICLRIYYMYQYPCSDMDADHLFIITFSNSDELAVELVTCK